MIACAHASKQASECCVSRPGIHWRTSVISLPADCHTHVHMIDHCLMCRSAAAEYCAGLLGPTSAASTSAVSTTWCSLSSQLTQAVNDNPGQGTGQKHMTCSYHTCVTHAYRCLECASKPLQLLMHSVSQVDWSPISSSAAPVIAACQCGQTAGDSLRGSIACVHGCQAVSSYAGSVIAACPHCMMQTPVSSLLLQALLFEYVLSWMHNLLVDCCQPSCCIKL